MADLILGLDVGTTAIKAALYDLEGVQRGHAEAPAEVMRPQTGWAEQDMQAVWQTAAGVLAEIAGKAGGSNILSIGIAAQGDGLWMLDDDNRPIGNAILWNDTRAGPRVSALAEDGSAAAVARACHTANWPGTCGSIFGWLKAHGDPQVGRSAKVVFCSDWIGFKLTGVLATDYANASIPFLDLRTKTLSRAALDALGCSDLERQLSPPVRSSTVLGEMTADAAGQTGLPEGTPVSVGTLDLGAMIVGMGMSSPGQTMMILGTTAVVNILTSQIEPSDAPVGATAFHSTEDVLIRILAPTTGAAAFDWFTSLHPQSLGGESAAAIAERLNALVRDVPPGSNGVTFLPYLNGERAPFVAPQATAAFHGLTARTTKAEMGRAVMEGAAFSLRHCFEAEGGLPTAPVQLTGGGARNALWCDIIADCLGAPVEVSTLTDHGLWGAACIGAAAAGLGRACSLAERNEQRRTHTPDPDAHEHYNRIFRRYRALSAASHSIWEIT